MNTDAGEMSRIDMPEATNIRGRNQCCITFALKCAELVLNGR